MFFISGSVLASCSSVMVIADYSRDWKTIQRTFMRLDARKTREADGTAREKAYGEERDKLRASCSRRRAEDRRAPKELARLNARQKKLDPRIYAADQDYKFAKASFDAERYKYEDALANSPKSAPSAKRNLERIEKKMDDAAVRLATLKRPTRRPTRRSPGSRGGRDEGDAEHREDVGRLQAGAAEARNAQAGRAVRGRNSPILDMVNPSLRVQQVQLPEHYNDVNFMKIPRVDRCADVPHRGRAQGIRGLEREVPFARIRS